MNAFSAEYIKKGAGGEWITDPFVEMATGFSYDTRKLNPGNIFLALKTEKADGHLYLKDAYSKGAIAAVVEKPDRSIPFPQLVVKDVLAAFQKLALYHRNNFEGNVYGITGSCGKTTSKDWLSQLLGVNETCSTIVNENNLLGVPVTLMRMDSTVHQHAVIEAGMNIKGEMEQIAKTLVPDICLVTNVYPVHLEWVGGIEDIAYEKALLAKATRKEGGIIFPYGCFEYKAFRDLLNKNITVLLNHNETCALNDLKKEQICIYKVDRPFKERAVITLQYKGKDELYEVPFMSKGKLANAALVILTAREGGVEPEVIQGRIAGWKMAEYRGEWVRDGDQNYFVDCYNANPVAMVDAIEYFNEVTAGEKNRLYVLGCMGELGLQSKKYHYTTGQRLGIGENDQVLVIGKDAESFAEGIRESGVSPDAITCLSDKELARERINNFKGSIFLKGSKVYRLWELVPALQKQKDQKPCLVI